MGPGDRVAGPKERKKDVKVAVAQQIIIITYLTNGLDEPDGFILWQAVTQEVPIVFLFTFPCVFF